MFAGRLASPDGSRAGGVAGGPRGAAARRTRRRAPDLLLDGLAAQFTEGYAAGLPILRRALTAFGSRDVPSAEELRWLWLACIAALRTCGTTTAGTCCPTGTSGSPATPARSASFRSP